MLRLPPPRLGASAAGRCHPPQWPPRPLVLPSPGANADAGGTTSARRAPFVGSIEARRAACSARCPSPCAPTTARGSASRPRRTHPRVTGCGRRPRNRSGPTSPRFGRCGVSLCRRRLAMRMKVTNPGRDHVVAQPNGAIPGPGAGDHLGRVPGPRRSSPSAAGPRRVVRALGCSAGPQASGAGQPLTAHGERRSRSSRSRGRAASTVDSWSSISVVAIGLAVGPPGGGGGVGRSGAV